MHILWNQLLLELPLDLFNTLQIFTSVNLFAFQIAGGINSYLLPSFIFLHRKFILAENVSPDKFEAPAKWYKRSVVVTYIKCVHINFFLFRKCYLSETATTCRYKVKLGDGQEWYSISEHCRNRVRSPNNWAASWENLFMPYANNKGKQQRRRSACASTQSDQRFYCLLPG